MSQFQCFDRVKDVTTSVGTGAMTLTSVSPAGYRSFASVVFDSRAFYYLITTQDETVWEIGKGSYSTVANALLRDVVFSNSLNTTALINFAAGEKSVSMIFAAQQLGGIALPYEGTHVITTPTAFPTLGTSACLAIGEFADASGADSIAIYGTAAGASSMTVGFNTSTWSGATNAVALGNNANASGIGAISIGNALSNYEGSVTVASAAVRVDNYGKFATIIGGQVCTVNANNVGNHSYGARVGGSYGNGRFAYGDSFGVGISDYGAGYHTVPLRITTTDATVTPLDLGGIAATHGYMTFPASSCQVFTGTVQGRSSTGDVAAWEIKALVKTDATQVPTIVGTPTITLIGEDAGAVAWDVALAADATNKRLNINVTGAAATTINWLAVVRAVERT